MSQYDPNGFGKTLQISFQNESSEHCEGWMPITPEILQPFGFVHGGATLSLLESVASQAAEHRCDLATSIPFGVAMDVRHRKPGKSGYVHGTADLESEEPCRGGTKQTWRVVARDDSGDVMSEGTFTTKIITLEYFQQRQRNRH